MVGFPLENTEGHHLTWERATALRDDEREAEVSTEKKVDSAFLPAASNKPSLFCLVVHLTYAGND